MTVRIGVIGCGTVARRQHIPLLRAAGAEVTAFASGHRSSAEAAAEEAGGGAVCDDWRTLLARPDVDAVTICTPNALHADQAVAAAEAGKHLLVEKPLTISVATADAVIAAARRAGVVAMTAHNLRFAEPFVAARIALAAGDLGTVTSVRAAFCHAGPLAWSPGSTWFLDPDRAGGGVLLDLGVHLVDTLRWLLTDELVDVSASLAYGDAHVEQDAAVAFSTRNGVVGSLHAGWRSTPGLDLSVSIVGTKGTVHITPSGATLTRAGSEPVSLPTGTTRDSPQAAFVRAVEAGHATSPDLYDGRAAVAVVEAAYTAARTGRRTAVA